MSIDERIIQKKLQYLLRYGVKLKKLKRYTLEEISEDLEKTWAIEHGLQLAIQVIMDIGNHILVAIGEYEVEDYTDVIDKLGEREVIPPKFAEKIRGMAGFRNILIHEYTDVDISEVYEIIQNRLEDFEQFAKFIDEYLEKK